MRSREEKKRGALVDKVIHRNQLRTAYSLVGTPEFEASIRQLFW
jgi:hypothetical protein